MHFLLYVDDERDLLELGRIFLEENSEFTVRTLASAKEALDFLAVQTVDAIISDYQMPEMDGLEFLKVLRARGDTTHFIIFTGRGREEVVIEALNAGADFYLQKGGEPSSQFVELVHKIKKAVEGRRSEEALRESEEKYRRIVETANEGILQLDDHSRITYTNQRMAEMLGYTLEEIIGEDIGSFMPKSELADHALRAKRQQERVRDHFEQKFVIKSGVTIWTSASITPVIGTDGNFKGSFAMYTDITQRKQAEDARRKSDELFKSLVSNSSDLTILTDEVGIVTYVSPQCERVIGYPCDKFVGQMFPDIIHPDDAARCLHAWEQVVQQGVDLREFEYRIVDSQGGVRWISHSALQTRVEGSVLCMQNTIRDITDRKRTEEALWESEARYRLLVENQQDLIVKTDEEGRLLYVNPAYCELFDTNKEDLLGGSYTPLIHPDDLPMVEGAVASLFDPPHECYYEERAKTRYGWHYLGWTARAIKDNQGRISTLIGIGRDITEQKQAEEALRESEEKYRTLIETLNEGVWVIDRENVTTFVNHKMAEILGYAVEEMTGRSLFAFMDDKGRQVCEVNIERRKQGVKEQHDFEFLKKDGTRIYATLETTPITGKDGEYLGAIAGVADITDRKRSDEALRERERVFFTLISNLPGFVYRCANDRNWTMEYISEGCRGITGYAPEDFLGNAKVAFNDIVHPEFQKPLWDKWQDQLEKRGVFEEEYPIITNSRDTRWVWERGQGIFSDDGRLLYLEGFITDITDRKRVEEALRERSSQIKALIDNLPFDTWAMDLKGQYILQNPESIARWGDFVGKSPHTIPVPAEMREHWLENNRKVLIGKPVRGELSVPFEDGVRIYDEIISPIRLGDEISGIIGVNIEITDRKRVEEALRQANCKLKLLSGITRHDINNQLTMLQGYLAILKKKQPDTSFDEDFQKVSTAAKRISSMIQFTKEYEKIGVHAPAWQGCRKLVDTATKQVPLGQVRVKNDLPAGAEVLADPLIGKVFYNLMDNAVRYGEKITTIRFSALESGDDHLIVCEDDGDGVVAEEKGKIFERGFGKNTGLGLALSCEILAITGITICETGEPGKGTRFEMTVPKNGYRLSPGS
jgi:PAS domain S-box-containing protein